MVCCRQTSAAGWLRLPGSVQKGGLLGYCQPVEAGPQVAIALCGVVSVAFICSVDFGSLLFFACAQPANASDTSDFCVGLFLLVGREVARLTGAQLAKFAYNVTHEPTTSACLEGVRGSFVSLSKFFEATDVLLAFVR